MNEHITVIREGNGDKVVELKLTIARERAVETKDFIEELANLIKKYKLLGLTP